MSLTLYFLRHGQTPLSRDDSFCGSGLDPSLTAEGLEMASAFASEYKKIVWSAIYSSPLSRTVETARPLCETLGIELQLRDGLKELAYGRWEGLTKDYVKEVYHDDYISWLADPAWHPPTDGETAVIIARRGLQVIEEIKENHYAGNILIVSHKATVRILLCSLLGIDVGRFRYRMVCPVASVSSVEFTQQGPLLLSLADRSHLSEKLKYLAGT